MAGEIVFYDGTCGLCHRAVRFVLEHDHRSQFRFAPLGGRTYETEIPAERRRSLPDSLVVRTGDGSLRTRSDGVLHILRLLGSGWGVLAGIGAVVPRPFRDAVYDGVARVRRRVFRRPSEACPVVPEGVRQRFLP
jgi:predicted DCC family thiol-disulfide oxidoreductase YuxK